MTEKEYSITYTGMDGIEREEAHFGDRQTLAQQITGLEERGAQLVSVELDGTNIYEDGTWTSESEAIFTSTKRE